MLHHIVMWKLKEEAGGRTKKENALLIKTGLEALAADISVIRKIEVGINRTDSAYANFDVVLDSFFDNYQDMEIYQQHPLHQKISAWISEVRETRAAVDYDC